MVLVALPVEVNESGAHPEMDEVQTKVDCLLGLSGECSCKIYHGFPNRREFH